MPSEARGWGTGAPGALEEVQPVSKAEFMKVYGLLGVKFDLWLGESFYDRMARQSLEQAITKKVAKWSEQAAHNRAGRAGPADNQEVDEATLYSRGTWRPINYRMAKFRRRGCFTCGL